MLIPETGVTGTAVEQVNFVSLMLLNVEDKALFRKLLLDAIEDAELQSSRPAVLMQL